MHLIFVDDVIALIKDSDSLIKDYFDENKKMRRKGNFGFQIFLNQPNTVDQADYLAKYADWMLTKSLNRLNDLEKTTKIDELTKIIYFINEKDKYFLKYQDLLAYRLLNETKQSDEDEKNFINTMRVQCGQANVKKIDEMLVDLQDSKKLCEEFRSKVEGNFPI